MPTYSPDAGHEDSCGRPLIRLTHQLIADRINMLGPKSRARPYLYMDAIDSIINVRPDIDLVVADARSSDIVRESLAIHHKQSGGYELAFYPDKLSQWTVFNDVLSRSSDIIWAMDWVSEAIKEFDKDPSLQIIFPTVNSGDAALPVQLAKGPMEIGLIDPADHINCLGMEAARAPCLNAYAIIFRIDFLKQYGGYPDIFRNCFTESFLYFMCEAMGGKMRLCPRAWCYHHNGGDIWGVGSEVGGYNYLAEKHIFDRIMNVVQQARETKTDSPEFYRKLLYKQSS